MSRHVKRLRQKKKIIRKERKQVSENDNKKSRNNTRYRHLL